MDAGELQAAYLEVMLDEPGTSLAEFMERVAAGRYGPLPSGEAAATFLREVERNILGSILTRAANNPSFAAEAEARAEATREQIAGLIARFGGHP